MYFRCVVLVGNIAVAKSLETLITPKERARSDGVRKTEHSIRRVSATDTEVASIVR